MTRNKRLRDASSRPLGAGMTRLVAIVYIAVGIASLGDAMWGFGEPAVDAADSPVTARLSLVIAAGVLFVTPALLGAIALLDGRKWARTILTLCTALQLVGAIAGSVSAMICALLSALACATIWVRSPHVGPSAERRILSKRPDYSIPFARTKKLGVAATLLAIAGPTGAHNYYLGRYWQGATYSAFLGLAAVSRGDFLALVVVGFVIALAFDALRVREMVANAT